MATADMATSRPSARGEELVFLPTTFSARALYVGGRFDLRTLESSSRLAVAPTVVRTGPAGVAVLFRYGVAVLFNVPPLDEASFLRQLTSFTQRPFEKVESEEAQVQIQHGHEERSLDSVITLERPSVERLQCIADILAKSVVLGHTEASMARVFDKIEPLSSQLERDGTVRRTAKELLRHIGGTLRVQTEIVARVEVVEKPELLWDRPELELLYTRLEDEYELSERHNALERKFQLVSKTAETLLGLLHHDRSLRVEWYIVVLIVVEICLTLYELFLR